MNKRVILFLTAPMLLLGACHNTPKAPLSIGHRGASGHAMENSLPAIQKAIDLVADALEIDVYRVSDGTLVVFHDKKLDRITNGTGSVEALDKKALDTVLLDGGLRIPTLEQVLDLIDKKAKLNIELKGANTATPVDSVIGEYISRKGWENDDFIISSFKWDELEKMRMLNPDIPIGILTSKDIDKALAEAKKLGAVAIHPRFKDLNAETTKRIQSEGYKVYTWTPNEPSDIERAKSMGVDGIITDYPDRVTK
ncbi:MAG: glycerophosphodiester phosphodiesterase [Bacteroidales bacterium]